MTYNYLCRHEFLLVEQWTSLGAQVECLECETTFHAALPEIESRYVNFEHVSGRHGPKGDMTLLVSWEKVRNGTL